MTRCNSLECPKSQECQRFVRYKTHHQATNLFPEGGDCQHFVQIYRPPTKELLEQLVAMRAPYCREAIMEAGEAAWEKGTYIRRIREISTKYGYSPIGFRRWLCRNGVYSASSTRYRIGEPYAAQINLTQDQVDAIDSVRKPDETRVKFIAEAIALLVARRRK